MCPLLIFPQYIHLFWLYPPKERLFFPPIPPLLISYFFLRFVFSQLNFQPAPPIFVYLLRPVGYLCNRVPPFMGIFRDSGSYLPKPPPLGLPFKRRTASQDTRTFPRVVFRLSRIVSSFPSSPNPSSVDFLIIDSTALLSFKLSLADALEIRLDPLFFPPESPPVIISEGFGKSASL